MKIQHLLAIIVWQVSSVSADVAINQDDYTVEVEPYGMGYELPPYKYDEEMETRYATFGFVDISILVKVDGVRLGGITTHGTKRDLEVRFLYPGREEVIGTSQFKYIPFPKIASDNSAGYLSLSIDKETGGQLRHIVVGGVLALVVFREIETRELNNVMLVDGEKLELGFASATIERESNREFEIVSTKDLRAITNISVLDENDEELDVRKLTTSISNVQNEMSITYSANNLPETVDVVIEYYGDYRNIEVPFETNFTVPF